MIKGQQGNTTEQAMPPLNLSNGNLAVKTKEKISALVEYFATKMSVFNPQQQPQQQSILSDVKLISVTTTQSKVFVLLKDWTIRKLWNQMASVRGCSVVLPKN